MPTITIRSSLDGHFKINPSSSSNNNNTPTTIHSLKQSIEQLKNYPIKYQHLYFHGIELKDNEFIDSNKIYILLIKQKNKKYILQEPSPSLLQQQHSSLFNPTTTTTANTGQQQQQPFDYFDFMANYGTGNTTGTTATGTTTNTPPPLVSTTTGTTTSPIGTTTTTGTTPPPSNLLPTNFNFNNLIPPSMTTGVNTTTNTTTTTPPPVTTTTTTANTGQQQPPTVPSIESLPVPEDLINQLMEMGITRHRAKKALILNRLDPNMAIEWIFTNIDNIFILDSELNWQEVLKLSQEYTQLANQTNQQQ
ncbi:hypothetical protein ABK040_003944 [Willaertia magna]